MSRTANEYLAISFLNLGSLFQTLGQPVGPRSKARRATSGGLVEKEGRSREPVSIVLDKWCYRWPPWAYSGLIVDSFFYVNLYHTWSHTSICPETPRRYQYCLKNRIPVYQVEWFLLTVFINTLSECDNKHGERVTRAWFRGVSIYSSYGELSFPHVKKPRLEQRTCLINSSHRFWEKLDFQLFPRVMSAQRSKLESWCQP